MSIASKVVSSAQEVSFTWSICLWGKVPLFYDGKKYKSISNCFLPHFCYLLNRQLSRLKMDPNCKHCIFLLVSSSLYLLIHCILSWIQSNSTHKLIRLFYVVFCACVMVYFGSSLFSFFPLPSFLPSFLHLKACRRLWSLWNSRKFN